MGKIRKADEWDDVKERTLDYFFAGRYSIERVAELVSVSARTVARWVKQPEFVERLEAKRANLEAALATVTYADKTRRILALNEMAESARCEYEAHTILFETRPSPKGGDPAITERFNRDAFECFRGALDDIAKEMGHRQNKVDVTSNGQAIGQINLEQLIALQVTVTPDMQTWRGERGLISGDDLLG